MTAGVPRVLVDTCTRKQGALIGREIDEPHSTTWGDRQIGWLVRRWQARRLDPTAHRLREQISFIASITAAMRAGRFAAYTSSELRHEGWDLVRGRNRLGDLWAGVRFANVDPPLERSTFRGSLTVDQVYSGKHQQEFCEILLQYARTGAPQELLAVLQLDDFQRANLGRLSEFRLLCEAVGPKCYRDAFHLWTALCNDLDYFLTTDEKFLRILRQRCGRADLVRPAISPRELVAKFDLAPEAPPVREGEIIPFPFD
jgi:hypothetical protein